MIIDCYENFEGVDRVLAARFAATIAPLTAARLAEFAIESVRLERTGRDGITYLIDAKRNGITTPLSAAYELEILSRVRALDLNDAIRKIRAKAARGYCPTAASEIALATIVCFKRNDCANLARMITLKLHDNTFDRTLKIAKSLN